MHDVGKVAMLPRGEWSNVTEYEFLDVVTYNDAAYVAKQDNTGHTPVGDSNDNYWMLLVESGTSGVISFNGRTGTVSPTSGDYEDIDISLSSTMTIGGDSETTVAGALDALNTAKIETVPVETESEWNNMSTAEKNDPTKIYLLPWKNTGSGSGVRTFNGRNGTVLPLSGDYSAKKITFSNVTSGLVATDVQDAIDELSAKKGGHTIVDANNVEYTARTKLKFRNATIQDDSANDTTIVIPEGGGGGIALSDVSGASAVNSKTSVTLKWSDPEDVVVSSVTLAEWAGTLVVRKAGSAPTSRYDGTTVIDSKTKNQYASNGYTDTGLTYGTTYYYKFFPYTTQGSYTDGTSLNIVPVRDTIALPTPSATLTYDTTEQTMTFSGYDSTKMDVTGDSATNAGTHTATFTPKSDYMWDTDSTTTAKTVSWTIGAKPVTVPTVTGSFTYDSSEKSCTVSSFSSAEIEQDSSSTTSATNAGTYSVYFNLTNTTNYKWSEDDSVNQKTRTWTIDKATGGCTLSSDSVTVDPNNLTATVTISNATGTLGTPTTSDSTVATASISGNTLTVSSVNNKSGSATITIPIAASNNYEAASKTVSVTASFLAIVTWHDGTDTEIAAMLEAHYNGDIDIHDHWKVGDERQVSLSAMAATGVGESHVAQTVTMVLMNEGGKTLVTPVNGHNECAFIVGQKNFLANGTTGEWGYMNSSNTNSGGWNSCARRTWCNSVYKNALPNTLIGIFKEHQNITANGSSSATATSNDYFALPSEKEVFGSTTYANSTAESSNSQFKYYETSSNRIKYSGNNGSASHWWERSTCSGYSYYFCYVYSDGSANGNYASFGYGLAPFGCI